jgi:anti-anti-sigma factor
MSGLARVLEDRRGGVLVAALDGEVDASNAAEVAERLRRALGNASTALVLDLSPTSYLDSAGISLLFRLAEELGARQQRLVVVVPPGAPVARTLQITGVGGAVPIHPDVAAAVAGVA